MERQPQPPQQPPSPPSPPPYKTYKLIASSISYTKSTTTTTATIFFKPCLSTPPTYILKDVSLTAHPSKILPIVGPSGAGKSTLLDILAARTAATSGTLLLNSCPINPSVFRKLSAYVPQHDARLPLLTVSKTFTFSARFLNPKSSNISIIVSSLVYELRLTQLAHTRHTHGRWRLDSGSALNVMQTLKLIATSHHRTVILSIHQPSFKILSTIDRILLLSKGKVVHHGTMSSLEAFLLSNGFTVPPQLNALEYAMEILNQLQETEPTSSPQETSSLPPPPPPQNSTSSPSETKPKDAIRYRSSRFHEIISSTKQLLLTNTLQALGVGLVLSTIYINIGFDKSGIEKRLGLFAFTNIPPLIHNRNSTHLLQRKTHSSKRNFKWGLQIIILSNGKHLSFLAIFACRCHYLLCLCRTKFHSRNVAGDGASRRIPPLLRLLHIERKSAQILAFMHYFSIYKYALDALLINEYSCLVSRCLIWFDEKNKTCMMSGRDVLEKRGLHERQR
ncbi:Transporter, ABC superfamily (Breast cancer resistance protein) [Handroanthus impetiginosus]|uniref:Transporter, ABC superfamily (Breast cancer resistance protein) n=1 Tax=Handroanthus impetiginosus TaxID=429701 RepID=A0A2G9HVX4_9LAMI|nr:Transporter, ABC superfamily (Breast cancer resistance protein) [Handroanthus impetiginosus]